MDAFKKMSACDSSKGLQPTDGSECNVVLRCCCACTTVDGVAVATHACFFHLCNTCSCFHVTCCGLMMQSGLQRCHPATAVTDTAVYPAPRAAAATQLQAQLCTPHQQPAQNNPVPQSQLETLRKQHVNIYSTSCNVVHMQGNACSKGCSSTSTHIMMVSKTPHNWLQIKLCWPACCSQLHRLQLQHPRPLTAQQGHHLGCI